MASVSYLQLAIDTTDLTAYTFSTQSFGVAASNRFIICGTYGRSQSGGATSLSSITIGGITATINTSIGSSGSYTGLACAAVPAGASGDVVVTWADTMGACKCALWRAIGLNSTTAFDTIANADTPTSGTIDVQNLGIIIGMASEDVDLTASVTWTGLTEAFEESATFNASSGAADAFATGETNRTITADWLVEVRQTLSVASFSPGVDSHFLTLVGAGA